MYRYWWMPDLAVGTGCLDWTALALRRAGTRRKERLGVGGHGM
jgi:hypothetical protein